MTQNEPTPAEEPLWLETSVFPFDQQTEDFKALGKVDVRVTPRGEVYLGDRRVHHPIIQGGVQVSRGTHKRHNILTLSLVVGSVTFEAEGPKE